MKDRAKLKTVTAFSTQVHPCQQSAITTIDPTTGVQKVLTTATTPVGCDFGGGLAYDADHHHWIMELSNTGSSPNLAVVNPTTGKLIETSNGTLPWSPWAMTYDNKTNTTFGVWVNEQTQVIQVVKLFLKTGGHKVVCDLPTSPYCHPQPCDTAISKVGIFDAAKRTWTLVMNSNYRLQQTLVHVNIDTGTFKQVQLPSNTYMPISSMSLDPPSGNYVGVAYIPNHGWWSIVNINPSTGAVTRVGAIFPNPYKTVYQYTTWFYDYEAHVYYLLTSNINQNEWYIYAIQSEHGTILSQAKLVSGTKGTPVSLMIPDQFLLV